jgi:peptidoglycan/xylan/chitin deacetylase (PgdA/CDA1 family)
MEMPLQGPLKAGLLAAQWYGYVLERYAFPGVLVLSYHGLRPTDFAGDLPFAKLHIAADVFEEHCRVLAEHCHPIALDAWSAANEGGRALPSRPVLLTFDDGYRSVFELARPILRRYRIPAAIFVCSDPVRDQHLFWFDAIAREHGNAAVSEARARAGAGCRDLAARYAKAAGQGDPLAPMTPDQVAQLAAEGFTIGAHTASHAPLESLSLDDQRCELEMCRDALTEWTGVRIDALAYPWGKRGADYTRESVDLARDAGFRTAFSTHVGFAALSDDSLERSRFVIMSEVSPAELAHRIAYTWPR